MRSQTPMIKKHGLYNIQVDMKKTNDPIAKQSIWTGIDDNKAVPSALTRNCTGAISTESSLLVKWLQSVIL